MKFTIANLLGLTTAAAIFCAIIELCYPPNERLWHAVLGASVLGAILTETALVMYWLREEIAI